MDLRTHWVTPAVYTAQQVIAKRLGGSLVLSHNSQRVSYSFKSKLCSDDDHTLTCPIEELPQSVNGTSVYNSSAANHSSLNTSDNVAQAFNGLNIYGPGPAYVGKPNTSSAPANVPFSANGTRFNNPAYYTLNDGRVFFAGNVGGQNHSPRGGPSFGSYPSSPYVQHPIQQNGNTPPANSHAGVWNSASQQQQQQQPADVPDLAAPRRTSLSSTEETGPQTPFFSAHAQAYYPKITVPDNSPQTWATPSPQQLGQSVPVQAQPLWRDSEGKQYILKDLDAICQDEPAIPRPIPAIFSDDKARGTLETSLENKNHTTNVYIRGLHPNTTDDMLIAYGARFGSISSAKSMIDQHTGLCKGYIWRMVCFSETANHWSDLASSSIRATLTEKTAFAASSIGAMKPSGRGFETTVPS